MKQTGIKNFEMDFKSVHGDKKQLRSLNLSVNSLLKMPQNLEKSIKILNISQNKLKSI